MSSNIKNALLWVVRVGLWIVPFIPLYVASSMFFPYITGKAFLFRTIVEICFFSWLFLCVFYKEYRPRRTALLIALGVWIAVVALATLNGVNPVRSFWSNFERMEGLVTYLHLAAYFLVLAHTFQKRDWSIFGNLFVLAGIFEGFYALTQRFGYNPSLQGGFRVDGTIGNPTYLAAYLIFVIGFACFMWFSNRGKPIQYLYMGAAFFSLLIIYFTASRGPVLALIIGGILASLLYFFLGSSETPRDKFIKKCILGSLAVLVVVPLGLWLLRNTNFIRTNPNLDRLTSLSFQEKTIKSRFLIWSMTWEGVKERPLLGWGPENYVVVFSKFYRPELWQQEPWFDRSHNIVFDWLIQAGILGFAAYISIFISALYLVWRNYRRQKIGLEIAILIPILFLVYVAQNFFVFDNLATYIGFFSFLAFIQSLEREGEQKSETKAGIEMNIASGTSTGIIALIALGFVLYQVNWKPLQANLNLLEAIKIQNQDYQVAFKDYTDALALHTLGSGEVREQLVRFAIGVGGAAGIDANFKDQVLRTAIQEAKNGRDANIQDPRAHLFLSTILGRVGLLDEALKVEQDALALSPNKQQIYFEIADAYLQKQDFAKAVTVARQAYDLAPDYHLARINLAAAYIMNNQQAAADKILKDGFKTVDVAENILVQVYSSRKQYDRLRGVWQAFVKSDPQNPEYRKSLAGAYLITGNKTGAISVLEQAAKDIPSFKSEAEGYIQQLSK